MIFLLVLCVKQMFMLTILLYSLVHQILNVFKIVWIIIFVILLVGLQKNELTLNLSKTKLMLFGTPHNLNKFSNISLIYDGENIEKVDHFKYLGIIFDSNMTWSHHIDFVASNVSKRCGVIRRVKYYLPNYILKKTCWNSGDASLQLLQSCLVKLFSLSLSHFPADYKLFWTILLEKFFLLT